VSHRRTSAAILLVGLAVSCGTAYEYVPTTGATTRVYGRPAADYGIPPEAPRGDVQIASYGLTDIKPQDRSTGGPTVRALHLRVELMNKSATPWTFDTREQRLNLSGRGPIAPAFASANAGSSLPRVVVPPNQKRVADLFFPLPFDLQQVDKIPEFDAQWQVDAGGRVIAQRTPFQLLILTPDENGAWGSDYGPGGGYYWSGPYWMSTDFTYNGVPTGAFAQGVSIERVPRSTNGVGDGGVSGGGQR
jgi:hypothetical protein